MWRKEDNDASWHGRSLAVHILYSSAGVATHIRVGNDKGYVLFDAGDGVIRDLLSRQRDINDIQGIVFTHGHFDHVGGLYSLLGFLRMIGREERLPIIAPEGCEQVFSIIDIFKASYSDTISFQVDPAGIRAGEIVQVAEMSVEAYPVIHCGSTRSSGVLDPIPAMGYRIYCEGETVAISGDTGNCPSLVELFGGVDLAIIESTYGDQNDVEKEYLDQVHLNNEIATGLGQLAKEFILVHKRRRRE